MESLRFAYLCGYPIRYLSFYSVVQKTRRAVGARRDSDVLAGRQAVRSATKDPARFDREEEIVLVLG
jgi:hypothetical protein